VDSGRRRRRRTPDEHLATAIEGLGARIEALGAQLVGERAAAEAALANAFGSLADFNKTREEEHRQLLGSLANLGMHMAEQRRYQEEKLQARRQLTQEKMSEAQVLRELTEAVERLRQPRRSSPPSSESTWRRPRYRPYTGSDGRLYEFPEVRVSVKIYQICNVDTAQMTYEADFLCHLDWCDPNVEGIPSEELKSLDWEDFFNPHIEVDNCKDDAGWLDDGTDTLPRRPLDTSWMEHLAGSSGGIGGGVGGSRRESRKTPRGFGPWLRKTMRFRGTLAIPTVNLKCFPFDIQVLPLKFKAARCRGLALGTPFANEENKHQVGVVHLVDVDDGLEMASKLLEKSEAEARFSSRGHFVMPSVDESLIDFDMRGLAACHPDSERGDVYEVSVFVERPCFASYFWDLVIMNLLVVLAATAFWDTASAELSSRMSISLTIILTLAAYTSSRPAPISKAPYVTFHDWVEQMCMFLVTGISVQNVFAVATCGGQSEDAPPYMAAEFASHPERCGLAWCFSRRVDCQGFVILLVAWFGLALYSLSWLLRMRRHATRLLRHRVPIAAPTVGKLPSGGCCRRRATGCQDACRCCLYTRRRAPTCPAEAPAGGGERQPRQPQQHAALQGGDGAAAAGGDGGAAGGGRSPAAVAAAAVPSDSPVRGTSCASDSPGPKRPRPRPQELGRCHESSDVPESPRGRLEKAGWIPTTESTCWTKKSPKLFRSASSPPASAAGPGRASGAASASGALATPWPESFAVAPSPSPSNSSEGVHTLKGSPPATSVDLQPVLRGVGRGYQQLLE